MKRRIYAKTLPTAFVLLCSLGLLLFVRNLSSAQSSDQLEPLIGGSSMEGSRRAGIRSVGADAAGSAHLPTFVALAPNLNDFGRFTDGGSDGNWYVGYNNAWIVELPPVPRARYSHIFIGAKLGRAKTRPKEGNLWEKAIIPGKVYVGISHTPAFTSEQSFFLADTSDIPLEMDPKAYLPGMGPAQWFWTEVPLGLVSASASNYLIVWSPTDAFVDAASSPILAALENKGEASSEGTHAWINRSIHGVPPRRAAGALETPINNLYPALAIKLVPPNNNQVLVRSCSALSTSKKVVFNFSIRAENPDIAWVEFSKDRLDWTRVSKFVRQPPYAVTLPHEALPQGGAYLRAVARDMSGNEGSCNALYVQ